MLNHTKTLQVFNINIKIVRQSIVYLFTLAPFLAYCYSLLDTGKEEVTIGSSEEPLCPESSDSPWPAGQAGES